MKRIQQWIVDWIITTGAYTEEDRPVLAYGLDLIVSSVLLTVIMLIAGAILNRLFQTVFFLSSFIVMRGFAGGYHATTYQRCYTITLTGYGMSILAMWIIPHTVAAWVSCGLLLCSIGIFWRYAPFEHPNRPFTQLEKSRFRWKTRVSTLIIGGIIGITMIFYQMRYIEYILGLVFGMIASSVSLLTATILYARQGDES